MKKVALYLCLLICITKSSYSQEEVTCLIYKMKLAAKSKDGKFYDYFLFAGKKPDTFQVIQVTNGSKTKQMPGNLPMLAALYMDNGKIINKNIYKNFPYLKRQYVAYFSKVRLLYD